jgi:prolyl-tRNA editing enzyme YbaK/EbsC (Cys-tRNA(Pro) deacylase)
MIEIHQTISNIFAENLDDLEAFECEDQFSDTQSFCNHYGFKIEDSCNAILLKSKKPNEFFALFCVLGSNRLDVNHKAKKLLNTKKISFASKEEAEGITNQIYGGISPLGLPNDINVFIDKKVMEREKVFIGGGNRVSKFFLKPEVLKKLTNGTVEDLTQTVST